MFACVFACVLICVRLRVQMVKRILEEKRSARYAQGLIVAFVAGDPWPATKSAPLFQELLLARPQQCVFASHLLRARTALCALGDALITDVRPLQLPLESASRSAAVVSPAATATLAAVKFVVGDRVTMSDPTHRYNGQKGVVETPLDAAGQHRVSFARLGGDHSVEFVLCRPETLLRGDVSSWVCSWCTLENSSEKRTCAACDNKRSVHGVTGIGI